MWPVKLAWLSFATGLSSFSPNGVQRSRHSTAPLALVADAPEPK
jgi:hypothetical protein